MVFDLSRQGALARQGSVYPVDGPCASFHDLIAAYRASPEFRELRELTQKDYNRVLKWLGSQTESLDPRHMEPRHVYSLRDSAFCAHKRRFANYVIQVTRLLLRWARERGFVERNVAEGIKAIKRPAGPRANRPWTDLEREVVLSAASIELRTVIAIGMYVGLRESDACSLKRSSYDGERIQVVAAKNQERIVVRVHYGLRAILVEAEAARAIKGRRRAKRSKLILNDPDTLAVTSRGKTWTPSGFRASFFKLIRQLYAEGKVGRGLTFHGLRHTLGKLVMETGGSKEDISLILGDRSLSMANFYSREHDKIGRTDETVRRMEAADLRKLIRPMVITRFGPTSEI
jgi:integrase